jgi:hypothetical protein
MQRLRRPVFLLIVGTTGALRQWQGDGVPARRPRPVCGPPQSVYGGRLLEA